MLGGANRRQDIFFRSTVALLTPPLSGQAVARNRSHNFAESIQFPQRRVNIRRDPKADEFLVNDWRCEDMMLAEEVAADLSLIQSFNLDIGDSAHLTGIE